MTKEATLFKLMVITTSLTGIRINGPFFPLLIKRLIIDLLIIFTVLIHSKISLRLPLVCVSCGAGPTPGADAPEMCDAPRHALIARGRARSGNPPVATRKIGLVAILD